MTLQFSDSFCDVFLFYFIAPFVLFWFTCADRLSGTSPELSVI